MIAKGSKLVSSFASPRFTYYALSHVANCLLLAIVWNLCDAYSSSLHVINLPIRSHMHDPVLVHPPHAGEDVCGDHLAHLHRRKLDVVVIVALEHLVEIAFGAQILQVA